MGGRCSSWTTTRPSEPPRARSSRRGLRRRRRGRGRRGRRGRGGAAARRWSSSTSTCRTSTASRLPSARAATALHVLTSSRSVSSFRRRLAAHPRCSSSPRASCPESARRGGRRLTSVRAVRLALPLVGSGSASRGVGGATTPRPRAHGGRRRGRLRPARLRRDRVGAAARELVGALMALAGVTWFLGTLFAPALYLHRGPLVHLHLSYPTGRLRPGSPARSCAAYVDAPWSCRWRGTTC